MQLEPILRPLPSLSEVRSSLSWAHFSNALIAFLFAASAPVAIILGVGVSGGLSEWDLESWIFAAFAVNGILTIVMSIAYRMPLAFFWTIPGTVLVGPALGHFSFSEVVGAYLATGLLLLFLGLTGSVRKVMTYLPMPIIMAMVAGVFLRFGLNWIEALWKDIWIAAPMTGAYVLLSAVPVLQKRCPPMIGVLVVGIAALALGAGETSLAGASAPPATFAEMVVTPNIYVPSFSLGAMVELVLPLTITVIAAQNAQGIAILQASGHRAPANAITVACGVGSLLIAMLGSVSTCLTGPSNAILVSGGERASQFVAAVFLAILAVGFGVFSPLFAHLMLTASPTFIATLAGLALLRVLQSAFQISFRDRFSLGALVAFMVTVADGTIFGIGAPFWGLVFGFAASWCLERRDFSTLAEDAAHKA